MGYRERSYADIGPRAWSSHRQNGITREEEDKVKQEVQNMSYHSLLTGYSKKLKLEMYKMAATGSIEELTWYRIRLPETSQILNCSNQCAIHA